MKAILLGSGGFWREMDIADYPPTLHVPWLRAKRDWFSVMDPDRWESSCDTIEFRRIAVAASEERYPGVPRLVVYMQETTK